VYANNNFFISEHDKLDAERRKIRKEEGTKEGDKELMDMLSDDEEEDEENAEFIDNEEKAVTSTPAVKARTTVRNLRIREDTAKYLINLNANSAHYDPKSRSMRENPLPNAKPEDITYAGDNFVRASGDVQDFLKMQTYAFTTAEMGGELHMQAAPSQAELVFKDFQKKKQEEAQKFQNQIQSRYGTQKELPSELLLSQTEEYTEYSVDGSIIKGGQKVVPKSRYEEDVYPGNHKSVWGSWWENGEWGYACCHQTVKKAYCIGQTGINLKDEPIRVSFPTKEPNGENHNDKKKRENDEHDNEDRKRTKGNGWEQTEEEQEEYRANKKRWDDPMASFIK
jgi:pre-mRNA-processing factor SLU7